MSNFVHIELNTSAPATSKTFYKSLFGWSYDTMTMPNGMTYDMVKGAQAPGIGLGPNPMPDVHDNWLAYVGVASVKRTIAKAAKLGAKIIVEFQPIPGMGAFGIFQDPTGATIAVWQMAPPPKAAKRAAPKKAAPKKAAPKKAAPKKAAPKKAAPKKAAPKKAAPRKAAKRGK